MTRPPILLAAAFLLLTPPGARAQSVATSFEALQPLVRPGDTLVITTADGRRSSGRLGDLTPSSLTILMRQEDREGRTTFAPGPSLSERDVRQIRIERRDSNWDGALWGGAIGGGPWLFAGAMAAVSHGGSCGSDSNVCPAVAMFTGPIGMAIGAAVDASLKKRTTVYVAPGANTSMSRRSDPLWNGMLIGFGVGSIPVALIGLGSNASASEVAGASAGYGAIGLLTGLLVDALNKDDDPMRPSRGVRVLPLLSTSKTGLHMSVEF